jgi:DNA-directed RNA polymerase delta subunit
MKKEQTEKRRVQLLAVVFLLTVTLLGGGWYFTLHFDHTAPSKTAVIVKTQEALHDTSDGQLRLKMNSAVQIYEDTMQDLNFVNLNEERQLRCKMKVDNIYIYDSGLIKAGDMVQADVIHTAPLKKGQNTVTAEIYNYDMQEEMIGQTNVTIDLYLND